MKLSKVLLRLLEAYDDLDITDQEIKMPPWMLCFPDVLQGFNSVLYCTGLVANVVIDENLRIFFPKLVDFFVIRTSFAELTIFLEAFIHFLVV